MDWKSINLHAGYNKVRAELKKIIAADNYGWEKPNWNLTDLLIEPTFLGSVCMQIINGETNTNQLDPRGPLKAPDGRGAFPFRLRVLSRQACQETADGRFINGWSAGNKCKLEMTPENTIFPSHKDPPKPGDVVKIKRGYVEGLTPQTRDAMLARGESPVIYSDKTVDEDGCIWCDFGEATDLLGRAGKRIVFPEYKRPDRALEDAHARGVAAAPRTITQWHFEEVPHDYAAKKAGTEKALRDYGSNPQDD
jgi:hypothetical protein